MSSSFVYFRKGKGPFGDGTSHHSRYEDKKRGFMQILGEAAEGNPKAKAIIQRNVAAAVSMRQKDLLPADVQGVPILSNMSIAYAPGDLIGLELMPVVTTDQMSGTYVTYGKRERLQQVKTGGRAHRGQANERAFSRGTGNFACEEDTEESHIGLNTILNQEQPLNEMMDLVEDVNGDLALNRERKIVTAVTTAANYPTANKMTVTAGRRWDESGAELVKDIQTGLAAMWSGRGSSDIVAWCCTEVWHVIQRSPALLQLMSLGDRGLVTAEMFCAYFGLDGLLVSDARTDTANIGQTAVYSRLWGNFFGLMRVSRTPQLRNASFGYTFRWTGKGTIAVPGGFPGGVWSQMWYDQRTGGIGSYHYKRTHYEGYVVTAADTAYLYTTPISGSV